MKNRYKKKKKIKQYMPPVFIPMFLGFPLIRQNWNQLWRLDTLENIKV